MRVIVVGAGGAARAVLARLGERWDAVVIDPDQASLDRVAAVRTVEAIAGDGSSRVVLERAGLADADAVLAASGDDAVNREVCRLALAAEVDRIVAIAADPDAFGDLRRDGVVVVSPTRLAARHVEINLEPRRVASAAFANGRAEAVEFRISPDSPLRGRPLHELGRMPWLVAAVLRGDQLIVPHGGTELQADDLVTVVGAAADYGAMVETFTGGQAHFPLNYGRNVAVAVGGASADGSAGTEALVTEALTFVRSTAAASLYVVHDDAGGLDADRAAAMHEALDRLAALGPEIELRPSRDGRTGLDALLDLAATESVGAVVLRKPDGRIRTVRTLEALRRAGMPALLAAGGPAYARIVTPARDSLGGWRAAWTAIDLAARSGLPLEAVGVVPPPFVAGESDAADVRRAVARIRAEASVQGVSVTGRVETGNPVRVFSALEPDRLVVLGLGDSSLSLLMPGLAGHIVSQIRTPVVVIPDRERG
jgi:Trk K+ transport system NAD-binding subunit